MLVLALLTEGESYGYELVTRLQAAGLADIGAGTVYPVLNRLERDGAVTSRLVASASGPARKYYLPTTHGTAELTAARASWHKLAATVAAVLDPAVPDPAVLDAVTDPAVPDPAAKEQP